MVPLLLENLRETNFHGLNCLMNIHKILLEMSNIIVCNSDYWQPKIPYHIHQTNPEKDVL